MFLFSGRTTIYAVVRPENGPPQRSTQSLPTVVLRPERLVDTLFAVTIVLLLAVLFINFGAAIDIEVIKEIFRRPIGPVLGTIGTCIVSIGSISFDR